MIATIERRIARLKDQQGRTNHRLDEHDEGLKKHNLLIEQNAKLIWVGNRKNNEAMEPLKLTHGIAMVGILKSKGRMRRPCR